jgi:DNA-binding transcriptional LysR family regulator
MVTSADGFERRAAGLDENVGGVVRISANEIFGVLILPRILPALMDANPGIEIEVIVSNTAANLLQRDADVAIRMFRPTQNDLIARKITELPLGLFAHRDYLATHEVPKQIVDLKDHRFIGFDRETSLIEVAQKLGDEFTASDFAFRCDNILSHIEAIRSGLGIGVTHQGLAKGWNAVERVLEDVPPQILIYGSPATLTSASTNASGW